MEEWVLGNGIYGLPVSLFDMKDPGFSMKNLLLKISIPIFHHSIYETESLRLKSICVLYSF